MKIDLKTVLTVRKGSQRVINKNFKKFYKKNLLAYKIETLKKVKKKVHHSQHNLLLILLIITLPGNP